MQSEEPPSTAEASASNTRTEAATTPTFIQRGSSLLREWNSANSTDATPEEEEENALISSPPPVVAPAVVLNETSEDSNATPSRAAVGVVPVATFVSNFVRTSVNEIRSHIPTVTASNPNLSSMRSEPGAIGGSASMDGNFSTVRSLDFLRNDPSAAESLTEEFFLVDGDLVAIPSSHDQAHSHENHHPRHHPSEEQDSAIHPPNHQHCDESASMQEYYYSESYLNLNPDQRQACRPNRSKMRRSVRGLKKWIKRKSRRNTKAQARDHYRQAASYSTHENRPSLSTRDVAFSDDTDDSVAIPPPSISAASSSSFRRPPDDLSLSSSAAAGESSAASSPSRKHYKKLKKKNKMEKKSKKKQEMVAEQQRRSGSSSSLVIPPSSSSIEPTAPPVAAAAAAPPQPPLLQPPPAAAATVARTTMPPPPLHHAHSLHRSASIAAEASFVGNADQLVEAGVLPGMCLPAEAYIEDRMDDYDKYEEDKKDPLHFPPSLVPKDADFKVDKLEAPNVESMLRRAGEFARDLEASVLDSFLVGGVKKQFSQGKSEEGSAPLSMATSADGLVHNDILKIVMLGAPTVDKSGLARTLRKSNKKKAASKKRTNNLGVDVHSWTPPNKDEIKFTIWNVHGNGCDCSTNDPFCSNFGAHPGTQSLFFSDRSLYLLVWDLAATNRKAYRTEIQDDDSDSSSDEEEDYVERNDYLREEANRQADRALQTDLEERVLTWVDCIAKRGSHSAVLPVALVPSDMSPHEAKRRCDVMQALLLEHSQKKMQHDVVPPKVLTGAETVLCVSLDTNMGMDLLEETIVAIATDSDHSVFDHVGSHANAVPNGTVQVLETARKLKEADHKLVSLDLLMSELPSEVILSVSDVMNALDFLASIGELFYFGGSVDASVAGGVLSQYIILSRKWLVSALSCILRNDLKRELMETRRFMNMQCLYSNQQFPENHAIQTFSAGSSSCPLLASSDTEMLWQSMSFMREAADKSSQLSEHSTTSSSMFGFLECLLVHTGVFLPLDIDRFALPDYVYFVPSLLAQADSKIWSFKSSEAYMTTLSHSWLFRDGAPPDLMEHVTVALLRDLYEFSHVIAASSASVADTKPAGSNIHPSRAITFPLNQGALNEFIDSHEGEAIGRIKIHQINCWKSSVLVKIGCVFPEGNELRESFVEIFVSIADQSSPHCVSSDAMRSNMQRLIVSGKGHVGHHGRKLWKGGYGIVLDSIKASVAHCTCSNVERQVVCPECLAHSHPSSASTWSWDSVRAAAGSGSAIVRCMRGHRVDSNLICGTRKQATQKADVASHHTGEMPKKSVKELLPSVVVVGLWDAQTKAIRNVGSGFFVDKKQGLIVTAGHILFSMDEGPDFGRPYFGLENVKAVIGVIPSGDEESNSNNAVFRYFAEIVAEDIHNVDACVLKIATRMEEDVDSDSLVSSQSEIEVNENILGENLPALKLTRRYELEEAVRILGFNQGGEGLLEKGKHVNRSADFAKGYICKQFKMQDDDNSDDDSSCSGSGFSPREEIVIMCPTISGHSGGPCVNDEGKVIGILSRADPVDRQRCYLAPSNELKSLVNKARKNTSRGVGGVKIY